MADYPTTKLDKALAQRAATSSVKPAWRELMERHNTVAASKALQAPDVLQGFSGSWASMYSLGGAVRDEQYPGTPAPIQRVSSHLGQPGMGEINFRPYDYGTNRHGKYGPSLLGHPISFEIVGPTLKQDSLLHQWYLSLAGGVYTLNLDSITVRSTVGVPEALPVGQDSILEIYGINTLPEEGLYVVISMTGSGGTVRDNIVPGGPGDGGLGDGLFGDAGGGLAPAGAGARTPVVPRTDDAKYEIFRVVDVAAGSLVLDSVKPIVDYFDFDIGTTTPIVRAVTLLKPAAARLVAVPGAGSRGAETTFAFVPPARALNADYQPIYTQWTTSGLFSPWGSQSDKSSNAAWGFLGTAGEYDQKQALPIPMPKFQGIGRLQGINGEAPAQVSLGRMRIVVSSGHFDVTADLGRVLQITDVRQVQDGNWETADTDGTLHLIGRPKLDRLLGFYEIVGAGTGWGAFASDYYDLRMVASFDPETGVPFYGDGRQFVMATGSAAGQEVTLEWTLHDPVESLWESTYLSPMHLDSARLQNIIDPSWVQPTLKRRTVAEAEGHQGLPDKAIFDTSSSGGGAAGTNANPGSLLDLGFRVVLFPAKVRAGVSALMPDFDRPIMGNDVVLDPSVTDPQWIEIDYAAGLVHLSHPPVVGGDLIPDGSILTTDDNPRREVVFFASFVPFSREPGQTGANPRVTVGQGGRPGDWCQGGDPEPVDAFSGRLYWPAATQNLSSGPQQTIELDQQLTAIDLPPSGFVDVLLGDNNPHGAPLYENTFGDRLCTFGYSEVDYIDPGNGNNTTLRGTFGGAEPAMVTAVQPGVTPATVVLRRSVITPNTVDGRCGTDYQFDTTYGWAKRSTALRFKHGTTQVEQDGSLTISTTDPKTTAHEELFADLFSSWALIGGEMVTAMPGASYTLDFTELTVLISGVRSVLPAQQFTVPVALNADRYVYIDGSDPNCPVFATAATLPLPSAQDVLLGRYTTDGVGAFVDTYVDLRRLLTDLDKRLDVTVGANLGFPQPSTAHFPTLVSALKYVDQVMQSGAGLSSDGQFHRIRVVGGTVEPTAELPYTLPPTSGIIIEGAAQPGDMAPDLTQTIQWGNTQASLFQVGANTGENYVFRNLNFVYDSTGQPASTDPTQRNLFLVNGLMDSWTVEKVTYRSLNDDSHGFIYGGAGAGIGMQDCIVENCLAEVNYGVHIENGADTEIFARNLIRGNSFEWTAGVATTTLSPNEAGIWIPGATGTSTVEDNRIENNRITGNSLGIVSGGNRDIIVQNVISKTFYFGILSLTGAGDSLYVLNNHLIGVHNAAGGIYDAGYTLKAGIRSVPADREVTVRGNFVSIHGGVAGTDASIDLGGTGSSITDNEVSEDILFVNNTFVSGNRVDGDLGSGAPGPAWCLIRGNQVWGTLTAGTGCQVSDNYTSVLVSNGDAAEGKLRSVQITGNFINGDLFNSAASAVISGNRIEGDLRNDGIGYVITGNFIDERVQLIAGGGPDPDPNGIFVANRVNDQGAAGNPFYGGALPGAGVPKDNNEG